jgi:hypothetical protein
LGWPWDQIAEAALRFTEADQHLQAASVRGDVNGKAAAELDRETAIREWGDVREEVARQWVFGLRAALELHPESVRELLSNARGTSRSR